MRLYRVIFAIVIAMAAAYAVVVSARAADAPTLQADDHILGKKDAPITIFEYASLTCPHCAAFTHDTLPKVKANWIDTGKAKLVYRDFPLDQSAVVAATIARCFPPDRYFPFIETLFDNQREWAHSDAASTKAALSRIARLGGMSQEQFDACASNQKISDAVLNSRLVAQNRYGVDSTPTFFINGTKVDGDLPYDEFVKYLNAKTGEAAPNIAGLATAANEARRGVIETIRAWFGTLVSRT
ncbi:MAG: DsbA family protein [Alphaproteobacteria bacterium]|nr:DsbA family protein [Alphaproteobacteria bacterium]